MTAYFKYGAWCGAQTTGKVTHQAFLNYEVITNNDTTYTIRVYGGINPWNTTWSNVTVDYWMTATDYSNVSGQAVKSTSTGDNITLVSTRDYSYTKGHSAVTKTIAMNTQLNHVVSSAGGSSVNGKTSTASVSFTIPARTSYTVSFNANGGSGAPAAQTKWYNETLTLSSTRPTRENWTFLGWSTSASAASPSYSAGGSYTSNATTTLYAVWEHIYIPPVISDFSNATTYRTSTSSSTAEDTEGTYLYVNFDYVGGHYSGESELAPTCVIKLDGTTLTPAPTLSASGSVSVYYSISGYATSDSHTLSVKLYDSINSTGITAVLTIPSTTYPLEFLPDGSIVNIGIPARFKDDVYIDIDTNAASGTVDGDLYAAIVALGWENDVIV